MPYSFQIVESTKSWQESWHNLVGSQLDIADVYAQLYDPIVGATDGHGRDPTRTSERQLQQTFGMKEAYTELRSELLEEINAIETHILRPALDARKSIDPIRKTIKKRENKRLDLEKCQEKAHKLHRKAARTPKEDAQLSKTEEELANLNEVRPRATFARLYKYLSMLICVSRSLKSLMLTYERLCPPLSKLPSAWSHPYSPPISSFKTGCSVCTTPSCMDTVKTMGSRLRHRLWKMLFRPGVTVFNLPRGRLNPFL